MPPTLPPQLTSEAGSSRMPWLLPYILVLFWGSLKGLQFYWALFWLRGSACPLAWPHQG